MVGEKSLSAFFFIPVVIGSFENVIGRVIPSDGITVYNWIDLPHLMDFFYRILFISLSHHLYHKVNQVIDILSH